MSGTLDQAIIDRAIAYHGSLCPGLAAGIQAGRLALREVGRASEENRANDGKAVRIAGRPAWASDYQALRARVRSRQAAPEEVARFGQANAAEIERLLAMAPEELYDVQEVHAAPPATATVDGWTTCAACGEVVMETRARARRGRTLCVPCFEQALVVGHRHRRRPETMADV